MKILPVFLLSFPILMALKPADGSQKIILFGDSITEIGVQSGGYIDRMRSLARAKFNQTTAPQLIGSGVGGDKIYDLYLRLEDDVLAHRPQTVVIYIGVNDVWHRKLSGCGTDADKFERFYRAILKKLSAAGIRTVLCTPAAIGEKHLGDNEMDAGLEQFSNIIRRLAGQFDLPLCDLRQLFMENSANHNPENLESGLLTTDGVHLNAAGNQLVAEQLAALVF